MSDRESSKSVDATTRREFLGRCVKAGVTVAAAGGAAAWLLDRPTGGGGDLVSYGDYRVADTAGRMSIVEGADRAVMVQRGLDAIGGLDAFIKPGERVLIKVNAAFASPASLGATSHPDLVGELVRLCLRVGAKSVVVTDNPINDPAKCFQRTGIGQAVSEAGGRIVLPKDLVMTGPKGAVTPKRTPVVAGPWLNFTGTFGTGKSALAIFVHPSNSGYPQPWILRKQKSCQNAVYPGRHAVSVSKDKPLALRYRLLIHKDADLAGRFAKWSKAGA